MGSCPLMRRALLVLLALAACDRRFLAVPEDAEWIAWVELDERGEIVRASPLLDSDDGEAWAIDPDRTAFVAFSGIDGLLDRAGDWSAPLRPAAECDPQLVPSWTSS